MEQEAARIVIIGGGFGGIKAALELEKKLGKRVHITLIANTETFAYHAFFYKVLTGKSMACAEIPIEAIIAQKPIAFVPDTLVSIDLLYKRANTGSGAVYPFDYVILAMGSEAIVSNGQIPVYPFKTMTDVVTIHAAIHKTAKYLAEQQPSTAQRVELVVVGAGPAGVEVAAELGTYCQTLASHHNINPQLFSVVILEMQPNILPFAPQKVAQAVSSRLKDLGIPITTNTTLEKYLATADQSVARIVITTTGVKAARVVQHLGVPLDKNDKVVVDPYLRVNGLDDVFAIGDIALVKDAGHAFSAMAHATYVASFLTKQFNHQDPDPYQPGVWPIAMPIGPKWAVINNDKLFLSGWFGYLYRKYIDLKILTAFIPIRAALSILHFSDTVQETCPVCEAFDQRSNHENRQ